MLSELPDRHTHHVESRHEVCGYHRQNPGKPYAGCTCTGEWRLVHNANAAVISAAAKALGRKGGLKGGPARAASLSAKRRSEISSKAARTRWANQNKENR